MIPKPRFLGAGAESDARLVELARSGDERAFELIVRRHRKALVWNCRRLGLGEARAEDAVQQAFLSAWLALRRGDEVRDLRPWLARIAHNKAVNLLRARIDGDGGAEELSEQPAPRGGLDDALALRQTLSAVAALPERQRDALLLSAVDGRSYEEVASALGVSPGAVRGLLQRARATLRGGVGAVSPVALARWASGWLRRASMPAGRVAELATPASGGNGPAGAVRAAAAAVTTLALAAGVAVGPLHGLISQSGGHGRHSGAVVAGASSPSPPVTRGPAHADPVSTAVARGLAGARAAPTGPLAVAPVAGRKVQPGAPTVTNGGMAPASGGNGRSGGEGGGGTYEPSPAASSEPAAAVASSPAAPPPAESPTTSTPAPEPPPVAGQPEAPREPEGREHETEHETPGETDDPPEPTGTETVPRKDD